MFEKQYSCRPSFFAVMDTVPVDCFMCFPSAMLSGSASCESREFRPLWRVRQSMGRYAPRSRCRGGPRLLLGTSPSSVRHCEHAEEPRRGRWAHFVVDMQVLEEAFFLGGWYLNHMPRNQQGHDEQECEPHIQERRGIWSWHGRRVLAQSKCSPRSVRVAAASDACTVHPAQL